MFQIILIWEEFIKIMRFILALLSSICILSTFHVAGLPDSTSLTRGSLSGAARNYTRGMQRQSRFGKQKRKGRRNPLRLPRNHPAGMKGHAIINGEYRETSRILMQRKHTKGLAYTPYGKPTIFVFIRVEKEINKRYIVFQDPYLPPGEGYLVVLKRIPIKITFQLQKFIDSRVLPNLPVPSEVPYEAYHLHLSNNIHGTFDRLNMRSFAYGIRTKFAGRNKARQRWEARRKMKSMNKRRFGIGKWRGKRSTSTNNLTMSFLEENRCFLTRLNVKQLVVSLRNGTLMSEKYPNSFYLPKLNKQQTTQFDI